jgi:hypothetical protein
MRSVSRERIAKSLIARLDALAHTARSLHHPEVERLLETASVATMRAVALELLEIPADEPARGLDLVVEESAPRLAA